MKKVFLIAVLFSSLIAAQDAKVDTATSVAANKDTVDVHAMVQEQMQKAMKNQAAGIITSSMTSPKVDKISVAQKQQEESQQQTNIVWQIITQQPLHIKIFEICSVLIVGFVALRRIFGSIKEKSMHSLKQKIALLRNEKVPSKNDPRLQSIRKQLAGNVGLFNKSEKHISRKARELKISKGELLLAARLKLYEVGKM